MKSFWKFDVFWNFNFGIKKHPPIIPRSGLNFQGWLNIFLILLRKKFRNGPQTLFINKNEVKVIYYVMPWFIFFLIEKFFLETPSGTKRILGRSTTETKIYGIKHSWALYFLGKVLSLGSAHKNINSDFVKILISKCRIWR